MLTDLITKSNNKLGIVGSVLVIEKDGTVVDDNESKILFRGNFNIVTIRRMVLYKMKLHNISSDSASLTSSLNEELFSPSSSSLSISSPINKISNNKQLQNEFWKNSQIPWNYLEPTVLKELQNGSRNKYVINAVVNRTVSVMKNIQIYTI